MAITQHGRDLLEDLQLRDDDHTDDLVGAKRNALGAAVTAPRATSNNPREEI